jgi:site-specific recombinase XerD
MFLDEKEASRLLAYVRKKDHEATSDCQAAAVMDRVIVETLLLSGLRNSEFCRLRVADTPIGQKRPVLIVSGEPRERREVHIPQSLGDLIARYVHTVRPRLLPDHIPQTDLDQPLILNDRKRPYERTNLYRRVVRILNSAGFAEKASVQLLRHSYGYLAYKRTGGNLLFVQRQLGHAHCMVTAIYDEFVPFDYATLANIVAASGEPPARRSRHSTPSRGR